MAKVKFDWKKAYKSFAGKNSNFDFLVSLLDSEEIRTKDQAKKALKAFTGGLSATSKMPCLSHNLSALKCNVGSRLAKVKGSTCYGCYALKGRYLWGSVQNPMDARLPLITGKMWAEAMAMSIHLFNRGKKLKVEIDSSVFRWHDSGDLQSVDHLDNIAKIATYLPDVKFWLPTREYKIVETWTANNVTPDNLCIRFSAHMNNSYGGLKNKAQNSIVIKTEDTAPKGMPVGHIVNVCHATRKDSSHQCDSCRKCWDKDTTTIAYLQH